MHPPPQLVQLLVHLAFVQLDAASMAGLRRIDVLSLSPSIGALILAINNTIALHQPFLPLLGGLVATVLLFFVSGDASANVKKSASANKKKQ